MAGGCIGAAARPPARAPTRPLAITIARPAPSRGVDVLTGSEPAFRRNAAACVYTIEAAHNPEVAGSNPAPLLRMAPETGPFAF